jgi:hypothetical protein
LVPQAAVGMPTIPAAARQQTMANFERMKRVITGLPRVVKLRPLGLASLMVFFAFQPFVADAEASLAAVCCTHTLSSGETEVKRMRV